MPDYYGTGRQPKSGSSYVGLAIGLVIALLAVSALPFVIPYLQKKEPASVRTAPTEQRKLTLQPEDCRQEQTEVCGMLICELDETQQRYWNLPNGVIVGQVDEDGTAAHAGILPGDVIVRIGGEVPDSAADCQSLLNGCDDGERVQIELYRSGEEIEIALPAE
ncbi:MAG: PDZ domain-containing protein [Oscillospiraceae bacterium]|nr:PDZ domain-containing protein [Oscillospiraceae bacterium]